MKNGKARNHLTEKLFLLENSNDKPNTIIIVIIIMMNIIEFTLAKDLLLFGNSNLILAILFCSIIYYQEFILKGKSNV